MAEEQAACTGAGVTTTVCDTANLHQGYLV
jgi:hypothetical protein